MNTPEKNEHGQDNSWQESQALFSTIHRMGLRSYLEGLSNLSEAFNLQDRSVRCIDEGTPGGIHIAGSGILLDTKDNEAKLVRVIEELRGAGVDGVYSHEGCGAAALYAEKVMDNPAGAKDYAIKWAEELASELGVPYRGHIEKLSRPKEFHNARIAYFDGSGKFDPFRIKDIPDGFIVSRYYLDRDYAKEELAIALSIAFGHHGLEDRFTKDDPFIIAPIEKFTTKRQGISMAELESDAREVAEKYGDRVIVHGFKEPRQ
ncbi:MAG: hypothetical protein Q7S19_01805 [bacterium]|nr:hypothetical protein [bacterium]